LKSVLTGVVSPAAYWSMVVLAAVICAAVCSLARRRPGPWTMVVARLIGLALIVDAVTYSLGSVVAGTWSASTSLPLALCDAGVIVAAVACWTRIPLLVELTYFWGLAGTLQAIITPDLVTTFPHLAFFEYLIGHLGIILAALFLVVGLRMSPRPGAVARVYAITLAYTAFVGLVDWASGADYMFLRSPPQEWTLLKVLGPWPWYIVSAAGVAIVLLVLLDLPFWGARRSRSGSGPDLRVGGRRREHPAATA
jgi:hypothetical integral membrane protein (TIGR02206 family)